MQNVIKFIVDAHDGQFRKGSGMPYVVHPIDVMNRLCKWGINDKIILSAAVCHDVLEECPNISLDNLAGIIGVDAAIIVDELTFRVDKSLDLPVKLQKALYLLSFNSKSFAAIIIKIADRLCNVSDFRNNKATYGYSFQYYHMAQCIFDKFNASFDSVADNYGQNVAYKIFLDISENRWYD